MTCHVAADVTDGPEPPTRLTSVALGVTPPLTEAASVGATPAPITAPRTTRAAGRSVPARRMIDVRMVTTHPSSATALRDPDSGARSGNRRRSVKQGSLDTAGRP